MRTRATAGTILSVILLALNFIGTGGYIEAPNNDSLNRNQAPLIKLYGDPHDIGIPNVTASKTVVRQGHSLQINVEVINYGLYSENFNVTAYANTTIIDTLTNITLTSGNSTTITFAWNTTDFPYGNYTISANATQVPDETHLDDNTYTDGWVLVTRAGDVNGDGNVDVLDTLMLLVIRTLEKTVDEEPFADIDDNGVINVLDTLVLLIIRTRLCPAYMYFNSSLYYPPLEVFREHNLSVPIGITVIDYDVTHNSIKVNVSSSIDSKEVTLTKSSPVVFCGVVPAVGIRMIDEPISNASILSVKYGDYIIAEYFDTSSGVIVMANAPFVFPPYIMEPHFNNLEAWKTYGNIIFDSNGIPMVDYGSSIGLQYNAVTISHYALCNYHAYQDTANVTYRQTFLVQANWLAENAKQKGNYSVWEYKFDWPSYGCTDPWVSGMAQGQALTVLIRAYVLTGNTSFIEVGEMAIGAFEVEMSAGGVRYTDSSGVWFEECADIGAPSSKILNGFIYALLALYEFSFETNSSKAWELFWEGTGTLSNNMYLYDTGSWSYYDLLHYNPATMSYHKCHIKQLRTMYELTGDQTFLDYSNKFQSYMA